MGVDQLSQMGTLHMLLDCSFHHSDRWACCLGLMAAGVQNAWKAGVDHETSF